MKKEPIAKEIEKTLRPYLFALRDQTKAGNELLAEIAKNRGVSLIVNGNAKELPVVQGDKGDRGDSVKGDEGHTPIYGKDFFTASERKAFLKAITPVKGKDYFDGKHGTAPVKGKDYFTKSEADYFLLRATPKKGKDYFTKAEHTAFKMDVASDVIDELNQAKKPLDPLAVRNALEKLQGGERLKIDAIKGLREALSANRPASSMGGSGSTTGTSSPLTTKGDLWGFDSADNRIPVGTDGQVLTADSTQPLGVKWAAGGGSGVTVATPSGTVNGVNAVFTVTAQPKWIVADGQTYFDGAGYTYSALSITLDIAPSSFIRAIL